MVVVCVVMVVCVVVEVVVVTIMVAVVVLEPHSEKHYLIRGLMVEIQ